MNASARILARGAAGLSLVAALIFAPAVQAAFHLFRIEQVFSNADGTVQFVVLHESVGANGENFWANHQFKATNAGVTNSFTFPSNLPSATTAGRRVLLATQGFAALGIVTPDFVLPNGFLPTGSGALNYSDVDFVSYTALPTDGVTAINRGGAHIPNLATNFSGQSGSVVPPPAAVGNFQGLWWNPQESGWGINFAHQGDIVFATWFTYGSDNKPQWFIILADKTATNVYAGPVWSVTGPPFNSVPFPPSTTVETVVGSATITFAEDGNIATFDYTVNGVTQTKQIVRQEFASPRPVCVWGAQADLTLATNYQDLWWATGGSEAGWGINFSHQGTVIFATWFTYDAEGKPWWLIVLADQAGPKVFSGPISTVTGPPFNSVPFDPDIVAETIIGDATITIVDGNHIRFDYTVNGVTQTKDLTRQVFAAPGTVCQ